ncbi:MAG: TRAP transporter substrate-binding protein [Candidatus Competibacterales bacterium]
MAPGAEFTLTIHHFLGPNSTTQAELIEPWAQGIEADSQGRLAFEIFPAMSLGGRAPALYSQVRDGVADIVWTLAGYTPGVFPRAEVFELPTVHQGSALATNLAIQRLFDPFLAPDFADVKPLLIHVHQGQAIHTVDRPVRSLADLANLKLRTPSRTGAWMLTAWGADPVSMPLPEVPQALSRGVVDGLLIPFEVVEPLRIHDLTTASTEGYQGMRFGTAVFIFAMNRERFAGLPQDLQAIIDRHSGQTLATVAGRAWDAVEPRVKDSIAGAGHTMIQLDAAAQRAFDQAAQRAVARWIEEVSGAGLDGEALVAAARAAVATATAAAANAPEVGGD